MRSLLRFKLNRERPATIDLPWREGKTAVRETEEDL
jgi:hypothetical protein